MATSKKISVTSDTSETKVSAGASETKASKAKVGTSKTSTGLTAADKRRRAKLVERLSKDPLCAKDRQNHTVEGFDFDQDLFENLIEYYTPKKDIPDLLSTDKTRLDVFCMTVYGFNFDITYEKLSKRSQFLTRMALQNLGNSGNAAAIKVASETFWGLLKDNQNADLKIQVVANIPKTDEGNGSKK